MHLAGAPAPAARRQARAEPHHRLCGRRARGSPPGGRGDGRARRGQRFGTGGRVQPGERGAGAAAAAPVAARVDPATGARRSRGQQAVARPGGGAGHASADGPSKSRRGDRRDHDGDAGRRAGRRWACRNPRCARTRAGRPAQSSRRLRRWRAPDRRPWRETRRAGGGRSAAGRPDRELPRDVVVQEGRRRADGGRGQGQGRGRGREARRDAQRKPRAARRGRQAARGSLRRRRVGHRRGPQQVLAGQRG